MLRRDVVERSRSPWIAIAIAIAAGWLVVDGVLLPPDFGHFDIYYFKDAGLNFAEGLGLTTRFSYGNPTFSYRDYSQYPPLYPLVYGLYTRATGISATSNQLFNSLVAVFVGLAGFLALRPAITRAVDERYRLRLTMVVASCCITSGYFGFSNDRPDGMAAALGITGLLLATCCESTGSALLAARSVHSLRSPPPSPVYGPRGPWRPH